MAVAACDRDAAGLETLAADLAAANVLHHVQQIDVTRIDDMRSFAKACCNLPPIALLFANAGILRGGAVLDMPIGDWRQLMDVNVTGTIITLQSFAPAMVAHGEAAQIVVTGSTGSMIGGPGLAGYCATKHALWPIVEALQDELDPTSVGASLLMPGAVSTPIFDAVDPQRSTPEDSLNPDSVAAMAFAGALAGHAKILTHPAYSPRIRARFEKALEELSAR